MYQEAGTYYEKAIAITPDHADYYRDYAIAEARQEHIDKAEEVLEQAKEQGLTSDGISLVEAEILLAGNNYEDAVGLFRKVLDTTENQYLKTRTYLLYARALRESGDGESEITVLEEARSYTEGADQNAVIRTLGAAYIRNGKKKDTRKAVECFEILQESGFATYHDSLNLASLYQKEKEFQKEKDILEKMKTDYPQDYQVFMQLAFLSCAEEGEKKEEERDYTETEKYYKKAVNLYEKKKSSGETDLNMENLELTMSQLYEKGWLEK